MLHFIQKKKKTICEAAHLAKTCAHPLTQRDTFKPFHLSKYHLFYISLIDNLNTPPLFSAQLTTGFLFGLYSSIYNSSFIMFFWNPKSKYAAWFNMKQKPVLETLNGPVVLVLYLDHHTIGPCMSNPTSFSIGPFQKLLGLPSQCCVNDGPDDYKGLDGTR
jgi:hypothetical protein